MNFTTATLQAPKIKESVVSWGIFYIRFIDVNYDETTINNFTRICEIQRYKLTTDDTDGKYEPLEMWMVLAQPQNTKDP